MNANLSLMRSLALSVVVVMTIAGCKPSEAPTPSPTPSQGQNEPLGGQPLPGAKQLLPIWASKWLINEPSRQCCGQCLRRQSIGCEWGC